MRKKIASLAFVGMLFAGTTVFAETSIQLNLNGTNVKDSGLHLAANSSAYGTVETFANYYRAKVDWDENSNVLKLNGSVVSNVYGEADRVTGTASIRALTNALGGNHSEIGFDAPSSTVNVAILPEGTVMLTPDVPQMGEHWANPKDMPIGPIYGVHNGKLVFIEVMLAKDLQKTVHDIPGNLVPIPSNIDHEDIDWEPKGHEGFLVPHYDVHFYFISREEQNKIVPVGGMQDMTTMDMSK